MDDLFQDHDCQNREMKLVQQHTQSRLWGESTAAPRLQQPHVGCFGGIFVSYKTNHIPLMNGFRVRWKSPELSPWAQGGAVRAPG